MTKIKLYTPVAQRFTSQWWLGGVRDFFFIATISLLVWIYADMTVTEDIDIAATIVLTTENCDDMVLLSPPEVNVTFKLGGTRKGLSDFQRELEKRMELIHYDLARLQSAGEYELATENILNNSEGPSFEALTILSASPAKISISLESLVTQKARVELDYVGATLTAEPKIDPAEVNLVITQRDLAEIPTDGGATGLIVLKTRRLDLRDAPTGEPFTREVEVIPPKVSHSAVRVEPKTVSVTIAIDQRTGERTVTVGVRAAGPATWAEKGGVWNEYQLVKKDPLEWRPQITVQGAKKDLEKLRPDDVEAYIMLREDDKTPVGSWLSRSVTVRFPPDADLQLVGDPPVIHFRIEKRPARVLTP